MKLKMLIPTLLILALLSTAASAQEYNCGESTTISTFEGNEVTLHHNENVKCESYNHVMKFLKKDKTDKNDFAAGSYECMHFSADVYNRAEKNGIDCAAVIIDCENGKNHMLVMFPLKNGERLFIEPQSDGIAKVEIGGKYKVFDYKTGKCIWTMGEIESIDIYN